MKVIDHEPHDWFLLESADRLYLDARVSRSAVEWSVLVELTPQERQEYRALGKAYLHQLAARIDNYAAAYADRNLAQRLGDEVMLAIREWRSG